MLSPKRVKHRKVQRGRIHGDAHVGNTIAFGEFGLVCMEPEWLTNRQIEAARVALNRYWVAVVRPGTVLFELAGVEPKVAEEAMRLAGSKLPVKTRFTVRADTE